MNSNNIPIQKLYPFEGHHLDDANYIVGNMLNHSLDINKWEDVQRYEYLCVNHHMESLQINSYDEYEQYIAEQKMLFQNIPSYTLDMPELGVVNESDKCEIIRSPEIIDCEQLDSDTNEIDGEIQIRNNRVYGYNQQTTRKDRSNHYVTPEWAVSNFIHLLIAKQIIYDSVKIYDPCAGNHTISNVVKKFIPTIDIYEADINPCDETISEEDYMIANYSDYDIMITNPPYNIKTEFIGKCLSRGKYINLILLVLLGKPTALLLPMKTFDTYQRAMYLSTYEFQMYYLCPSPWFIHNGKSLAIGGCAWFFFSGIRQSISSFTDPLIRCTGMHYLPRDPNKLQKIVNKAEIIDEFEDMELQSDK